MKISLFLLFSLLCVQAAFGASAFRDRPDGDTDLVSQSNRASPLSVFTNDKGISPRLNFFACFSAVKDIGSVAWSGFSLLRERSQINDKAAKARENCKTIGGTPDYLEKCLQLAEEERQVAAEELTKKFWELVPRILNAFLTLIKCVV